MGVSEKDNDDPVDGEADVVAKKKVNPLNLPKNTKLLTKSQQTYVLIELLQKRNHRAVYSAKLAEDTGERFVVKMEAPNQQQLGVKIEKLVAVAIQQSTSPIEVERFAEFVDYGESKIGHFIIWKKLGPSLDELHQMYQQRFTIQTAVRINVQTLQAISKLHALGFVHRNIAPEHFVVGDTAKRVVYLIGFSLARPFTFDGSGLDFKKKKKKKLPCLARELTPAQQYFAPRFWYTKDGGSHLTRIDDIESWFYLSLHFIDPTVIPWAKTAVEMLTDIFNMKKDVFFHFYSKELFEKVPIEYRRFIDEINATIAGSKPDHNKLIGIATSIAKNVCPNMNAPFDWEQISAALLGDYAALLGDYGNFKVPTVNMVPENVPQTPANQAKNEEDPEMGKLVAKWRKKFKKLISSGVSRADAYRQVIGLNLPPELADGQWKNEKRNKIKKVQKNGSKMAAQQKMGAVQAVAPSIQVKNDESEVEKDADEN
uniref:Protein kinase domain-containing protein n=1 Tax=Panagrolaimus sp. JU765 TaxID=591449 RepID=A0AC34Q970_9BILA